MKFKQKIFLSYLLFIGIFSLIFMSSVYIFFRNQNRKELLSAAEKNYSQAFNFLDYQLKQYLYTSYIADTSEEMLTAMNLPVEQIIDSPGKQYLILTQINKVIDRALLQFTDVKMRIYVNDTFHYIINHSRVENLSVLEQNDWYHDFLSHGALTTWQLSLQSDDKTLEEIPSLSLFRKMNTDSTLGWISELYISQSDLQKILTTASPIDGGVVFLQSQDGNLLSCTDKKLCQEFFAVSDDFYKKGQANWDKTLINGKQYLVYSSTITSTGWYMTLLLPTETFSISPPRIVQYIAVIMIIILAFSILAASFFSHNFSHRLLLLEKKMTALCAGDFDTRIEEKGYDEISHLFQCFNYMAGEMKHLIEWQYESGMRVKAAEFNALQAQINPHFLCNTLELINWKAIENDAPDIVQISQDLAIFYRLTLNNGHSMISLQNELNLVSRYLEIQNFRFSQEIQIMLDVPEDCMTLLIPKLTLQPLVENSIMHGFTSSADSLDNEKIIHFTAKKTSTELLITVSDNGIGMTTEQIKGIFTEKLLNIDHGFGVFSVQQRIKLLYGEDYGLTYQSAPGKGVTVFIRLKIQQ